MVPMLGYLANSTVIGLSVSLSLVSAGMCLAYKHNPHLDRLALSKVSTASKLTRAAPELVISPQIHAIPDYELGRLSTISLHVHE
jgi:hypothetical protein